MVFRPLYQPDDDVLNNAVSAWKSAGLYVIIKYITSPHMHACFTYARLDEANDEKLVLSILLMQAASSIRG